MGRGVVVGLVGLVVGGFGCCVVGGLVMGGFRLVVGGFDCCGRVVVGLMGWMSGWVMGLRLGWVLAVSVS